MMHNLSFTYPRPATVVPPGPKPSVCIRPASGINSIKGLSISNNNLILSLERNFLLFLAFFIDSSVPSTLANSRFLLSSAIKCCISERFSLKLSLFVFIIDLNLFNL